MSLHETAQIEQLARQVDRLLAEVADLRRQIAALSQNATPSARPVRRSEYFGLRANRDDMTGRSSREWLDDMFAEQCQRRA